MNSPLLLSLLLLLLTTYPQVEAILGYDCGARSLNVTTLSLLEVGQCDVPEDKIKVSDQYIQLLQINDYIETPAFTCKIEVKINVYHCGMMSHTSVVSGGHYEYIKEVSRTQCDNLRITGITRLYNTVFDRITINRTHTRTATLAGETDPSGNCKGSSFSDYYGSWTDVVVLGIIKFNIQEQTARVNIQKNEITFKSGQTCPLTSGSCVDNEDGYAFWNPLPIDSCKFSQYSILYQGYVKRAQGDNLPISETVYSLESQDTTFALTVKSEESICGYKIIRTEHPKLVIFETVAGRSFAENLSIKLSNMDIFAYINSKFIYVEKHVKTQITRLYQDIIEHRCQAERLTLQNSLAIAAYSPDQFAYNLMKGPGFMAVTAGEVVYIVKCIPVEVKVYESDKCYLELPVTRENKTMYLTPKTRILKDQGTEVLCNKVLPPVFHINEGWYKILPQPVETTEPRKIQPLTKPTWKYVSPAHLATSGIYSEEDLDKLRARIMFPVEGPAFLNDVARELQGHQNPGSNSVLTRLLNEDVVDKLFQNTWSRMWDKFMAFGAASAGVITLLLIFQTLKLVVDTLINGYLLYRVYGWSVRLLGAIWHSVAQLLLNVNRNMGEPSPRTRDVELAIVEPPHELQEAKERTSDAAPQPQPQPLARQPQPETSFFIIKE